MGGAKERGEGALTCPGLHDVIPRDGVDLRLKVSRQGL